MSNILPHTNRVWYHTHLTNIIHRQNAYKHNLVKLY